MTQISSELELLFIAEPRARDLFEKEREKKRKQCLEVLKREAEREVEHDNMIATCASAFAPGKRLSKKTGYSFYSSEPLFEVRYCSSCRDGQVPKCFDLLLTNETARTVIAIECKAAKSTTSLFAYKNDIRDTWGKIRSFNQYEAHLCDRVGFEIRKAEFVLCVKNRELNRAAKSLDTVEQNVLKSPKIQDPPDHLKLWTCLLEENRRLDLALSIQRQDPDWNSHKNGELNRMLRNGVDLVGEEMDPPCFASSPSWQQARAVVTSLLEPKLSEDGIPLEEPEARCITKQEVVSFFEEAIMHYSAKVIAPHLAETFIRQSCGFDLLQVLDEDRYQITVSGKRLHTVVRKFEDGYKNGLADRKAFEQAEELVLNTYRQRMPPLFPGMIRQTESDS